VLGAVLIYFAVAGDPRVYRYVDPFWRFGLVESLPMWSALAFLPLATVFVRNLYCRFLCPIGAALGALSGLTVFGIKRWSECNTCRICEKALRMGRHPGTGDHQAGVRTLRRLRAAVPRSAEMPALDHPAPGPAGPGQLPSRMMRHDSMSNVTSPSVRRV
jgi:hypothetical protein